MMSKTCEVCGKSATFAVQDSIEGPPKQDASGALWRSVEPHGPPRFYCSDHKRVAVTKPNIVTSILEPVKTVLRVGHLEIVSNHHKDTVVRIEGKFIPAKKIIVTFEVGQPTIAQMEWYPGFIYDEETKRLLPIRVDEPAIKNPLVKE